MKMYKKSDLHLVNGLLVTESGDIVMTDVCVIDQANELETLAQQADYLAMQPAATPMPSLDGFERKSIKDNDVVFYASTPILDDKAAEAMGIMDELDDIANVERANEMVKKFGALIKFAKDDFVIDCTHDYVAQFDTPTLGSVLDLTVERIVEVIAFVCGMSPNEAAASDEADEE